MTVWPWVDRGAFVLGQGDGGEHVLQVLLVPANSGFFSAISSQLCPIIWRIVEGAMTWRTVPSCRWKRYGMGSDQAFSCPP